MIGPQMLLQHLSSSAHWVMRQATTLRTNKYPDLGREPLTRTLANLQVITEELIATGTLSATELEHECVRTRNRRLSVFGPDRKPAGSA